MVEIRLLTSDDVGVLVPEAADFGRAHEVFVSDAREDQGELVGLRVLVAPHEEHTHPAEGEGEMLGR